MLNCPEPSLTPPEERDREAEEEAAQVRGDREYHEWADELDPEPPAMDGFASMIFDTACLLSRQYRRLFP